MKRVLLLFAFALWGFGLMAASTKGEMTEWQRGLLPDETVLTNQPEEKKSIELDKAGPGGGDHPIKPRRYKGHTFKEMNRQGRYNLGMITLYGGLHSGQFLNPSYGMLQESGHLYPKRGGFGGVASYQYYPILVNVEYAMHSDSLDSRTITHSTLSGFASLAVFPWFYSEWFALVPVIGIGMQHGTFQPNWKLTSTGAVEPKDVVVQPLYRVGLIINFRINEFRLQLIGNYYRSLFIKDQPHALNGYTVGVGFSGF